MSTFAAHQLALLARAVRPARTSPRSLHASQQRLRKRSSAQGWALSAAPTGVQPGAEMLEAQDAGGSTKEAGDTELQRDEEVPSNMPGDQVVAGDKPGQDRSRTHQPAVERAPGTVGGNQDDTAQSGGKPVQDEADLETILEQEAPQGKAAGTPDSLGDRVQQDVENLVKEESSKEEARFPGSTSSSVTQSAGSAKAPKPGGHREVPAGQRPTDPQQEPQTWEPPTTEPKIPLQEGTRIPGATS